VPNIRYSEIVFRYDKYTQVEVFKDLLSVHPHLNRVFGEECTKKKKK
jgi:hypothetical protein